MAGTDEAAARKPWQLWAEQRSLFLDLHAQWARSWVFMAYFIGALVLTWGVGVLPSWGRLLCCVLFLAVMWRLGHRSLRRREARLEVDGRQGSGAP